MIVEKEGLKLVQRFLDETRMPSAYVQYGRHLSIYLRKRPMITIANISMDQEKFMGRGIFTQFLEEIEPFTDVHVENVINPRLHGYLMRRGYRPLTESFDGMPISYERLLTVPL